MQKKKVPAFTPLDHFLSLKQLGLGNLVFVSHTGDEERWCKVRRTLKPALRLNFVGMVLI